MSIDPTYSDHIPFSRWNRSQWNTHWMARNRVHFSYGSQGYQFHCQQWWQQNQKKMFEMNEEFIATCDHASSIRCDIQGICYPLVWCIISVISISNEMANFRSSTRFNRVCSGSAWTPARIGHKHSMVIRVAKDAVSEWVANFLNWMYRMSAAFEQ